MFTKSNKIRMIYIGLMIITLLFVGATLSSPAARAQDTITFSGFCPFDVDVAILSGNQKAHEIRGGITIFTGALKIQIANAGSGKTLDLNISGPGKLVPGPEGSATWVFTGPWLLGSPQGGLVPELVGLYYSKGRVVVTIDAETGEYTSLVSQSGQLIDLCAALDD